MIKKKSNSFLSCDRKTSVNVVIWCPDETEYDEPVAVLQICHGMIEYIDRYDGFARYMAERCFVVVGNDHLGHGKSVCTDDDLGFFKDKNPGEALAKDAHHLTVLIKKMYPGIPYYLAGHSMGSFVTRRYICDYGYELDGVIVMGTGHQPAPMVFAGKVLADVVRLIKGDLSFKTSGAPASAGYFCLSRVGCAPFRATMLNERPYTLPQLWSSGLQQRSYRSTIQ